MAFVSVDEFRQYMQLQDTKHTELADRINQLQQSFMELRGQQPFEFQLATSSEDPALIMRTMYTHTMDAHHIAELCGMLMAGLRNPVVARGCVVLTGEIWPQRGQPAGCPSH